MDEPTPAQAQPVVDDAPASAGPLQPEAWHTGDGPWRALLLALALLLLACVALVLAAGGRL
jgi:hypothetical protein